MFYWIGLILRNIFPGKKGPNCEKTPKFLKEAIEIIKKVNQTKEVTQILTSKDIYIILITEEQKVPKIILRNLDQNFESTFKALKKPFLTPHQKEHLFFQIHNILPTKDRLIKCNQDINPECDQCKKKENVKQLFECKRTKPALNYIKKRISESYQQPFIPTTKQIYLLDFPNTPKTSKNKAIFLAANLSQIVWKKRKKHDFMINFMNSLKNKENTLKNHSNFKEWFLHD